VKDHRGNAVELPVNGWLVFNPANGFYELSANVGGRRIDHVTAAEFEFLDGRGKWTEHGNLGAAGSVVVRQKGGGVRELIDLYGNDRIALQAKNGGTLMAYDPDGKSLGKVATSSPRAGWIEFKPAPGARSYLYAE